MSRCKDCGRIMNDPKDPGSSDHGLGACQTCYLENVRELYARVVLVCGGRDFEDRDYLFSTLDRLDIDVVVNGNARGADKLSSLWAQERGKSSLIMTYNARWRVLRKAAGPVRNGVMLRRSQPSMVVAFPGEKGTKDMVDKARAEARKRRLEILDLRAGDLLL